jgi:hypothetical protein
LGGVKKKAMPTAGAFLMQKIAEEPVPSTPQTRSNIQKIFVQNGEISVTLICPKFVE